MGRLILHHKDGTAEIEMRTDETVLQAAHRHSVMIPTKCGGNGACGACICIIRSGFDDIVQGAAFDSSPIHRGGDLAAKTCQMGVVEHGTVEISTS